MAAADHRERQQGADGRSTDGHGHKRAHVRLGLLLLLGGGVGNSSLLLVALLAV